MKIIVVTAMLLAVSLPVIGQDIDLPAPQKTGGKPLFDAVSERRSVKAFSDKEVPMQALSTLLWSAYGFNREDKRVIPTPLNKQHLSLYVFLKEGVYLYDARGNKLVKKADGDRRKLAGSQEYVFAAPVNLLYIADSTAGMGTGSHIAVGCAAQDVYLACAAQGLGCVVRTGGLADNAAELRKVLKLANSEEPIAGQTVGYAKE